LEKADSQAKETLKSIIEDIYRVLGELKTLQEKVHPTEGARGLQALWKGFAWAAEKPKLVQLRTQINEKITILDYCRSGIELWVPSNAKYKMVYADGQLHHQLSAKRAVSTP